MSSANHQSTLARRGLPLAAVLMLGTALTFPAAAQAQDQPSTTQPPVGAPDDDTAQDEALAESVEGVDPEGEDPEVSIGGFEIVVTGRRDRNLERASTQVVDVLGEEQIARTGEGDIAGALGRVTGLSVQPNGLVYVRGWGERYSLALLNGLPLPSPQPLSRVVPLDIFPTNIVASSLVQKTYSANFPGEFGGGVINLTTRAVPDESFLSVGAGISGDTETTMYDGIGYYGSDLDQIGFDNGNRNPPPVLQSFFNSGLRLTDSDVDQAAIARNLINGRNANLVILQSFRLPANVSGSITGGTGRDIGSDSRVGFIASASISNSWRTRNVTSQTAVNADLDLDTDFNDFITDNRILVNGLLGFGLEKGDHRFRLTNIYIRDTLKQARLSNGTDFQNDFSRSIQDTAWFERQLFDTQFVGELDFDALTVDLRAGYAQTQRNAPFEWRFEYVRTNNENDPFGDVFVNVLDRQRGSASVVFSELTEDLYYGGIDLGYRFSDQFSASVGYAYTDTDRVSERREFLFNAPTSFPTGAGALRPDLLLGDAIIDNFGVGLIETTQSDPAFRADLEINAGYAKARIEPFFGLSLDIGARYEDATQTVSPIEVFATPINSTSGSLIANDYILPGGTLTYEASDSLQLRLSASKTIARPQFRELIFQTYFDPENNRQFNGNPFLVDSELINAEARAEYYFGNNSQFSLAGFFKDIDNPIEVFSAFSDNDQVSSFANAPKARLYGAEADLTYNYDLFDWGGFWENKRAVVIANYTYTDSEIIVDPADTTFDPLGRQQPASNFFTDGVPLTGQSDHLVNFQLGLENLDRIQQATLLLSYASERVTSRGTSGLPDIVTDPGLRVDFVMREEVFLGRQPIEFKFEARNIFGRDYEEFQESNGNRIEINSYDVGTKLGLSASFKF